LREQHIEYCFDINTRAIFKVINLKKKSSKFRSQITFPWIFHTCLILTWIVNVVNIMYDVTSKSHQQTAELIITNTGICSTSSMLRHLLIRMYIYNHMIYLSLFPYYSYFQFNVLSLVLLLSRESVDIYDKNYKRIRKTFYDCWHNRKILYAHFISIQMLKSCWKFTFKRLHNFFSRMKSFYVPHVLMDMNTIRIWG